MSDVKAMDVDVDEADMNPVEIAESLETSNPEGAIAKYQAVLASADKKQGMLKLKEEAISKLGNLYARLNRPADVGKLLVTIRPFFSDIPKAKTAKIVRTLIDIMGKIPDSTELQAKLCEDSISWCQQEKRTFLKLRIQSRLADLLRQLKKYTDALRLIRKLVREVKRIDDKVLLLEIELTESRVHWALGNFPKAKGSLTAARSTANAIYCPPSLQAQIDLQGGILCCEEKDYKTGFSYFYEAFENYNTINKPEVAVRCLKYMLLCKIMMDTPSDVYAIIQGKSGVKHAGREIDAMKAIADAHKERSIHQYQQVLRDFSEQLTADGVIHSHLSELYETLLEQNLVRLIEPFSRVEIAHVAKLIDLPLQTVENKLSEMILDQKFHGTLDQGAGVLVIFDEVQQDETYDTAIETVRELSSVVDRLSQKAQKVRR